MLRFLAAGVGWLIAGLVWLAPAAPATAQEREKAPGPSAEAYYQFLVGRLLEGEGDIDGAVKAYEAASAADPKAAEIRAELAALYARQDRSDDAVKTAEAALAIDRDNAEANYVLGGIYAGRVQARGDGPLDAGGQQDAAKAVEYLDRARAERRYDVGLHLTLGRLYLRQGQTGPAVEVLAALAEREPGVTEASWLLAQAYEEAGRPSEAIRALEEAVAVEPRFYRGLLALAEMYEKAKRWPEAASTYGRAAALNSRAPELRVKEASALLASGRTSEAREVLEEAVASSPGDGSALYLLADAQRTLKEFDAAEATARKLVALEPNGVRGAFALAQVYEARHDPQGVVAALQPALAREPTGPQRPSQTIPLLIRLSFAYQELGRFDEAIASLETARAGSSEPAMLDVFLAQAYLGAKRYDRAIQSARSARAARPDDPRAWRLEAEALRESGKVDDAIGLLRSERARFADDLEFQLALARLEAEGNRLDESMRIFDDADRQFPGRVEVAFQRGAALERQERYAEAETAFRQALTRDPLHAPTLNYLGYMLAERGEKLDEAIALVERALGVDPENPSYQDSLGWAWFRKGDFARAKQYLSPAADRLPHNSVVLDHLGEVLIALGDRAGAIRAWERAIAGDLQEVDRAALERKLAEARRAQK